MRSPIKYFLIGIICLGYNVNILAQEEEYVTHPDTLRVDLAEGQSITFAFKNIIKSHLDDEFDSAYSASITKIESILKLDSHKEPATVKLVSRLVENEMRDVVEITPISKDNKVYMSLNGEVQNRSEFNRVQFMVNDIAINIYLKQLADLKMLSKLDLDQLDTMIKEEQKNISSPKKAYYLHTKPNESSYSKLNVSEGEVKDFLSLTMGVGAGLFRDKLVPEIAFNTSVAFGNKHGITRHKMGIQTSFHYFFDRKLDKSYDMNINTFLTAFYKINLSNTTLKDNWMGLGFGYLAKSRGDYFEGNTFKATVFFSPRNISIIPELIISDDFKTVFPSLRFGLTF